MREKPIGWPDLEQYADAPLMNMKAVVQQTGIAGPTLRAWERRYTILSPNRALNTYRLYSERDIALIGWLKDRVDAGMSISQAIALFRHLEEEQNQLHPKGVLPERTSPSQDVVSTPVVGKPETLVGSDEQARDETYTMRFVRERLLDAFNSLDEASASRLMATMLAIYPIEQICIELMAPTLWEIGRLWEQGLIPVAIEHFASAFFHGWLTNLFHAMPTHQTNPLVIACCAPGELHELAPLMLSLLLRRAGLRVAYLGQSIETKSLLQTVRRLSPALICVSVTLISCLEAVIELGQKVYELPSPRPVLIFGGQEFEQRPDRILQVRGVYVEGEMQTVITQLRRMALQHVEDK
ncbi:MAG TPA: cobalamin B12-binding domain-containing protein [Ktedonobacteraceae bacterium]